MRGHGEVLKWIDLEATSGRKAKKRVETWREKRKLFSKAQEFKKARATQKEDRGIGVGHRAAAKKEFC